MAVPLSTPGLDGALQGKTSTPAILYACFSSFTVSVPPYHKEVPSEGNFGDREGFKMDIKLGGMGILGIGV